MSEEIQEVLQAVDRLSEGGSMSPSIAALAAALAKAQGEMQTASKDKQNPHYKSRYADLASVWDACRAALSKNGLAVLQPVRADGPKVTVSTILAHSSGEWISEALTIAAQQNTAQGIGSAITYGRRYGLSSMVGIAPDEDDDGNAAAQSTDFALNGRNSVDGPPMSPPEQRAQDNGHGSDLLISDAQRKRLYAIGKEHGWADEVMKDWLLNEWGYHSSKDIRRRDYDAICKAVEGRG